MGELPLPRKERGTAIPNPLKLIGVLQVILNWLELDKVFGALSHQNKYALIFVLQHTMRSF
jgi:hypothetical protein